VVSGELSPSVYLLIIHIRLIPQVEEKVYLKVRIVDFAYFSYFDSYFNSFLQEAAGTY